MSVHVRLVQIEMYLPQATSGSELQKTLGALKRHCKSQHQLALAIEPFREQERGGFSLLVTGTDKPTVEHESDQLMSWLETNIAGQVLASNVTWL